jgi:hypothetical protein
MVVIQQGTVTRSHETTVAMESFQNLFIDWIGARQRRIVTVPDLMEKETGEKFGMG